MIKSFTDLEQSRKLAEILPLDSANMQYISFRHKDDTIEWIPQLGTPSKYDIPGWSLAALLELLPKRLQIGDNVYELSVYLYGLYYWNITNGNPCFESKDKDNLVDACYEAIVFLHEQKLL